MHLFIEQTGRHSARAKQRLVRLETEASGVPKKGSHSVIKLHRRGTSRGVKMGDDMHLFSDLF